MAIKKTSFENKNTGIVIPQQPQDKIMGIDFNEIKDVVNNNADQQALKQDVMSAGHLISIVDNTINYSNPDADTPFKKIILLKGTNSILVDSTIIGQQNLNWLSYSALSFSGFLRETAGGGQPVHFSVNVGTGLKGNAWAHLADPTQGDKIIGTGPNDTYVFTLKLVNPNELTLYYGLAVHSIQELTNLEIYGKLK